MGWGFRADIPRPSMRAPRRVPNAISIGVHGWCGRWLVNGASRPLVSIQLRSPTRAWVVGYPVRLREVVVSTADPDALIAALS